MWMVDPNKFTCSAPVDSSVFLECTLPNPTHVETLTMVATFIAVAVSLGIAVVGGILARRRERTEKSTKQKLDTRRAWNESAMPYVEAIRELSNQYPKVDRSVDDSHFSAFNYYAALADLPQDHAYMITIRKINDSIELFLEVWVRKNPLVKIPKGALLSGTTAMRDLFSPTVQNTLRDYCKLIIEWHFQPEAKRAADSLEQIQNINTRLENAFRLISKDYIEVMNTKITELPDKEPK